MRSLERNMKAISPVLAVLMMIAVAIAGSLVTYAWVMGYIGFSTEKAGKAIMIQSVANTNNNTDLVVYVQNVGEGVVELDQASSLYVNGELKNCTITPDVFVAEGDTATLFLTGGAAGPGEKFTVKVTTLMGTFTEKSDYPASTTGGGSVTPTPPPTVTQVRANEDTGFDATATVGNLLVAIAGHRSGDPVYHHAPTITESGWTPQGVAWYDSTDNDNDRRIVALFTKIADGSETTVTVDWDDSASSSFVIYQEFTGASTYLKGNSGTNWEGWRDTGGSGDIWADGSIDVPSPPLADPGTENILTIGAIVWRDDSTDITSISASGLGGLITGDITGGCVGASAYSYGSAVTQTTVTWIPSVTDMVSGLLIQFECS